MISNMKQNVHGIFLQSWLVGNKGVLKEGGGGVNYSSPLEILFLKSEVKVQRR